jgi:hypothetical protein
MFLRLANSNDNHTCVTIALNETRNLKTTVKLQCCGVMIALYLVSKYIVSGEGGDPRAYVSVCEDSQIFKTL